LNTCGFIQSERDKKNGENKEEKHENGQTKIDRKKYK
jgi:hypothetical protein